MNGKTLLALVLITLSAVSLAELPELCSLPPVVGPCRARKERFYYQPSSGLCELFYYGGCEGNANNFVKPEQCEDTCMGK